MPFVVDRVKGDAPGEPDDYLRDVSVFSQTEERLFCSRLNNFRTSKTDLRGAHRAFLDRVIHYYVNKFGNLDRGAYIEIVGRASRRRNDRRRHLNGDLAERRAFQVQAYLEASAANSGAKLARRIYRGEGDEESSRSLGDSPNDGRQRAVDVNINAGTKVTTPPPEPGYENFEITLLGGLTFGVKAVGAAYSELIAVFNIAEIPSAAGDIKETTTEMKYYFASPFGLSITSVGPKDILPMLAKEWKKLVKPTTSRILRSPPFAFKCSKRRFATDFVGYATFSFKAGPPDNYRLRPAAPSLAPAHTIPPELGTLAKVETLPPFDKLTTGSWAGMLDNTNPPEPFRTMFRKLENGT